jgi:thioredoxin 1
LKLSSPAVLDAQKQIKQCGCIQEVAHVATEMNVLSLLVLALAVASSSVSAVVFAGRSAAGPLRASRVLRRISANVVAVVNDISSEGEFKDALSKAGDALVVIDYSTSWCGPCKVIAPKFAEMSEQFPKGVFYKVIGDSSSDANKLMSKQGIRAVPTFQLWKGNTKICEISGAKAVALEEAIVANL